MPSLGHVLPSRPSVRQASAIPPGSVLAAANRKAEAVVTIGPWRVVFIPDAPVQVAEASQGSPPCALYEGVVGCQQERDIRRGLQQSPGAGLPHPVRDPDADRGCDPAMPAGLVWIDVDQPAADRAVALPADPLAPGLRFKSAAPSSTVVALGPLGSVSVSAVSWALLSQVFWVPLLAIDLHDRWVARQRDITPPGQPLPSSPIARGTSLDLNALLGAVRPLPPLARPAGQAGSGSFGQAGRGTATGLGVLMSRAGSGASSLLDRPFTVSLDTPAAPVTGAGRAATVLPQTTPSQGLSMLGRAFTRAQLLGGSVSLADLQEGPMAPLALVERALGRSSADPLAPLPALWREPMRQALLKLPGAPQQLDTARMVYVPSSSISQPVEVPLALQSDGSVDILEVPANPALLGEIRSWSRQQRPPARGSLTPAVVRLHPLPQAAPLIPLPASAPAASAVTAPQAQLPAPSAAAARPIAVPLTSEAPAVSAPAAPIAVPMVSEATAPLAPSAAGSGDPVAPAP